MRNKYRHLFALSLMVFSLSLISCTVNDFSSSNQSTSSSTTTTSQNDDKLSFQINIYGDGQVNAYFDGVILNSDNFDDVVDVGDIVVIDCQKSFGYYLDRILINQENMEQRDNYYIFNVSEGNNIVDVYFEKIATSIDDFSFIIENNEATLVKYEQPNVTLIPDPVIIPDEVIIDNVTYPVTKIDGYALSNRDVHSYQIGKNVKKIEDYAFGSASYSLENIYVDEANTNFISCDGILYDKINHKLIKAGENYQKQEITLLDDTLIIGIEALSNLRNVRQIHLNNGLEKIDEYALANSNISTITIPNSVTDIGGSAFQQSALEEVILSSNLTTLGVQAFYSCSNLKSIAIPSSLQIIPEYAFNYCRNLKEIIFNEGLLEIQDQAFVSVPIESITFPNSLKRIGNSVFSQCFNLVEVNFNDGLEEIGNYAFERANNIESINLPSSLTKIGYNPFAGILRLGQNNNFTIEENQHFEIIDSVLYQNTDEGKILITYPMGKTNADFIVNEGVIRLENASFMYQRSVFTITLPTTLKSIGDAFENMYLDMPSSDQTYSLTINYLGTKKQFQEVQLSSNWHNGTAITDNAITCLDGKYNII